MGQLGISELLVIFVIALLVFGPKKLPELGKSLGKGLKEFKKATDDLKSNWDEQVRDVQSHVDDVKSSVNDVARDIKKDVRTDFYAEYDAPAPHATAPVKTIEETPHADGAPKVETVKLEPVIRVEPVVRVEPAGRLEPPVHVNVEPPVRVNSEPPVRITDDSKKEVHQA